MGRSNNYKNVINYEILAKYYDSLLQDEESLVLWFEYIEKYIKGNDILELASGSGMMAKLLKNKGYNVLASDISESMLNVAKHNYDGEYRIIDMIDFSIEKKFDLVLSIVDSFNYLSNYDYLKKTLKNIYEVLKNNGVLIFDMHHEERLKEFSNEYIEEGYIEDIAYQWTIQSDIENRNLYEHFLFYENDGMISEHHIQFVFDKIIVKEIMEEIGYKVTIIDEFIKDEKILVIGEKV